MPTDKNKISAYLSDEDFHLLGDLAARYRVSKSQIVIMALHYLAKTEPPSHFFESLSPDEDLKPTKTENLVQQLRQDLERLRSDIQPLFEVYAEAKTLMGK